MTKRIIPVADKRLLKQFIDFPHELYKGDPNYVPELFLGQQDILSPGSHPFYQHSSAQLFLAYEGEKIVGRIAAIFNNNHNEYTGRNDGFFGFFDVENDQNTADLLLDAATTWLKEKNANTLTGPVNLSTNDTVGLLVDGFDRPPMIMMTYNKPYYEKLLSHYGLTKKTDLLAYLVESSTASQRSLNLSERLEERLRTKGIVIRQVNLKDFKNEIVKVRNVYNKAWDKNLGFVPMTEAEFEHVAKDMKLILDPRYCLVAEKDNEFVGFILGLPNINEIQINIKKGRLLPTGIFKLLFNKRKIKTLRVLMLGVLENHRKLGIEACLYAGVIKNGIKAGVTAAECSWMLEKNYLMNHAIEQINGKLYKRYRLFEKAI